MISKSRVLLTLLLLAVAVLSSAYEARALDEDRVFSVQKIRNEILLESAKGKGVKGPSYRGMETEDDSFYIPQQEPVFKEVQFLKHTPPATMQERVERLLHGVTVDLPPEYDHYGYELRRYMASIGGPDVLGDRARLESEMKNIKKAGIVLDYWQKVLVQEVQDIKAALEADEKISRDVRSAYSYNQARVNNFINDAELWIRSNEEFGKFMLEHEHEVDYQYHDPKIEFLRDQDRDRFIKLYKARERARLQINTYQPFMMMVY